MKININRKVVNNEIEPGDMLESTFTKALYMIIEVWENGVKYYTYVAMGYSNGKESDKPYVINFDKKNSIAELLIDLFGTTDADKYILYKNRDISLNIG